MDIDKKTLYQLYHNEGFSQREIADQFDCSRGKIKYRMKKWDIKKRSKSSAMDQKYKDVRVETNCPVCGKKVVKPKSSIKEEQQAIYCSQKCAYKGRGKYTKRKVKDGYNTNRTKITKICDFCEDKFIVNKTNSDQKYCSRKCFEKSHSERMSGESNPSYIDGRSKKKRSYRGEDWKEQRKKCYKRDDYTCQKCNRKCVGRRDLNENNSDLLIQCHHVTPYSEGGSNKLSNLITLCVKCHTKIHN